MKVTPSLALATCSIGFLSFASAVHAQSGWQIQGYTTLTTSPIAAIGTGSNGVTPALTTVTSTATASSTGSQRQTADYTSRYQFSELVTYEWVGKGPSVPFHVSVTPTATASASTTPFTFASSSSSASTQPPSVTASASASGGTVSGNNNPGSYSLLIDPGGVTTASLTLNLDAFANGNVYVSGHLFSCASSAIVSLGAPTVP